MSRLGPLARREFRLLFLARATSFFGSSIAPVAIAFAVLDLTGSATDLGIVLAARMIPQLVFLLIGGVWADRLPRHLVMVVSDLVTGGAQAVTAALLLTGNAEIWHLVVLQAVGATGFAFFFPASTGLVPQTVEPALLQQANATLRMALNVSSIGGAALGGILVAAFGRAGRSRSTRVRSSRAPPSSSRCASPRRTGPRCRTSSASCARAGASSSPARGSG